MISVYLFRGSLRFLKNADRAIATVIEIETISDSDGSTYKPVFRFKTRFNEEKVYRRPYSSSPAGWKVGDEATLAYDANNPDNVKLITYFGSFGLSMVLMAIAMPLIIIGGGFIYCQQFLK